MQISKHEFENYFPIVKIFDLDSALYAYDGKSGMLAEVTLEEIDQIYNYLFYSKNTPIASYLKDLLDDGVFLPGPFERITPNHDEIDDIISSQLERIIPKTLILEITERCNLNCKYCLFAKEDGFNKRKHAQQNISEATAYKAIDYYYSKYINAIKKVPLENRTAVIRQNKPSLQWWGGEPFTAFDLILKTKLYFESLDWELHGVSKKDIIYALTSNLTIFNNDILNFIVQNNVILRVSLDGDEKSHNKNRVFSDGKGSFNITLKNLNMIINKYPNYAKNCVGIQSVLADNIDVLGAQEFIDKYFNLNTSSNKLITCTVSPQRKKNAFLSEFEFTQGSIQEIILSFKDTLNKIIVNSPEEIKKLLIYNKKLYAELRKIISTEDFLVLNSPKGSNIISGTFSCPLAADTVFISVSGYFHCCAKTDYSFPFGHIKTGINKEILKNIYISYHSKIEKQCKNCWALRFCKICPAVVCNENLFLLPQKKECEQIRKNVSLQLSQYIVLTEKYKHLYSQIKSYNKGFSNY